MFSRWERLGGTSVTTVTAWLSVSGTGVRTFYLGADSQGTSLRTGLAVSLHERKVYDSASTPEIFAISGDLSWGSSFLRSLLLAIERGSVDSSLGTEKRVEEFCKMSCARRPTTPVCDLEVLYGVRDDMSVPVHFKLFRLYHAGTVDAKWQIESIGLRELGGNASTLIYSSGSGGRANKVRQKWIAKGDQGDVARTCFWSLCDLINGIPSSNFMTGGHPQLVKLDQQGHGNVVGVKFCGVPTVYGRRTTAPQSFAKYWVDEYFTQLDPITLERYKNGQQYGRRDDGR